MSLACDKLFRRFSRREALTSTRHPLDSDVEIPRPDSTLLGWRLVPATGTHRLRPWERRFLDLGNAMAAVRPKEEILSWSVEAGCPFLPVVLFVRSRFSPSCYSDPWRQVRPPSRAEASPPAFSRSTETS